jgi:hypothetical protein
LVPLDDIDALYLAVSRLLNSSVVRKSLGENARRTVCDKADICLFASRLELFANQIVN